MKLTQKAVVALVMPAGKADHIEWDRRDFRLRLPIAPGCRRQNLALMGLPVSPRRRHPPIAARIEPQCSVPSTRAAWPRKRWASVANGEDPQADKADRRDKDAHTLRAGVVDFLAMKQREARPRSHHELSRYLTGSFFRPLHTLALDQITRKDVAGRLNKIMLDHSSISAARARAALSGFLCLGPRLRVVRSQSGSRHVPARRTAKRASACSRIWSWRQSGAHAVTTITARCIRLLDPDRVPAERNWRHGLERIRFHAAACGRCRRHEAKTDARMCCRCCRPCSEIIDSGAAHGRP